MPETTPSNPLSAADLERLGGLLKDATPRPWTYEQDDEGSSMGWIMRDQTALFDVCGDSAQQWCAAELVAAAINTLPALLATIAELRAERDEALMIAEGPSTLSALAAGHIEGAHWKYRAQDAESALAAERAKVGELETALRRHDCHWCKGPCERDPEDRDDHCAVRAALTKLSDTPHE